MSFHDDLRIPDHVTVAIVGGGPAGLGVARVLRDLAIPDVWVLERGQIGPSFLRWPSGTRLLTPSFPGNVFGITDLNAISYDSSPGWSLQREHPDGGAYAQQALLAMTTDARNAPLMLAVTAVAIPDQPLILAAIVIGMLVEFPHLTALKQVLLARRYPKGASA